MTEQGRTEALEGAQALKKHGLTQFDAAFTSVLKRANHTLDIIKREIGDEKLPTTRDQALNEREFSSLPRLAASLLAMARFARSGRLSHSRQQS